LRLMLWLVLQAVAIVVADREGRCRGQESICRVRWVAEDPVAEWVTDVPEECHAVEVIAAVVPATVTSYYREHRLSRSLYWRRNNGRRLLID
jgi:hypothetical protein